MDPKTIRTRLQELAFLNSNATIWFRALETSSAQISSNGRGPHDEPDWEKLHFEGGLCEYVKYLNRDSHSMHEPIFVSDKVRRNDSPGHCASGSSTMRDIFILACSDIRLAPGGQVDGVVVEVALQWCSDTFSDLLIGFVNSVKTIDGGTHIDGLKVSNRTIPRRRQDKQALSSPSQCVLDVDC